MKPLNRRQFLRQAAVGAAAGGLALTTGCRPNSQGGPNVYVPGQNFEWKMVTSWPKGMPLIGEAAELVGKWCEELSQGRLKVKVFGAGELVGALETFQAVSTGQVQMSHTAAYYNAGKIPATQLLTSVPFGMTAQQTNAWFYGGDGLKLYTELYAESNLVPFPPAILACRWRAGSTRKSIPLPTSTASKCAPPAWAARF
jgi:TRAP-type mannitol/chloroaromatic compound transport system substrate-binding protein